MDDVEFLSSADEPVQSAAADEVSVGHSARRLPRWAGPAVLAVAVVAGATTLLVSGNDAPAPSPARHALVTHHFSPATAADIARANRASSTYHLPGVGTVYFH